MPDSYSEHLTLPASILLVDDDRGGLKLLHDIFHGDYDIVCATSGAEALDWLALRVFDLVILDVIMPGMSGLDVLTTIRHNPLHIDLPVMMISGQAGSNENIIHALELGANDYIIKPFDIDLLQARVNRQIRIKRMLDEREQIITDLRTEQTLKDRFLRIASHDLKNPLNNIRLAQHFLRDVVGHDPQAVHVLDAIEETVDSMSHLIEGLLDTAALQSGKAGLNIESLNIDELIWYVIEEYSEVARHKEIRLVMDSTYGVVLADHERFIQVLNNLISNAIKYTPRGRSVRVSALPQGEVVRIMVEDEGPGIPPDEREALFNAFSKLSTRPTEGEDSSGLGLWIVHELVKLHGGTVGVDAAPGGGSIFWVDMPAALNLEIQGEPAA